RTYMLAEWIGTTGFALFTWMGMPLMGIKATGVAFVGLYAVYLPLVYWLAMRRTGLAWNGLVVQLVVLGMSVAVLVMLVSEWSLLLGAATGMLFAILFGLYGVSQLGN